jgi:hypothetical protein
MINGDGDGEEDGKILVVNDKRYKEEKARDRQKQGDKSKYLRSRNLGNLGAVSVAIISRGIFRERTLCNVYKDHCETAGVLLRTP